MTRRILLLILLGALPLMAQEPGIPAGSAAQPGKCQSRNSTGETTWVDCGGGGGTVSMVFGRTGAVTAATNDYTWSQIDAKPSTFTPSAHAHIIGDITDLVTQLAAKAAASHSHIIGDVTSLQTALDAKAAASHTHAIADTTGLQTALDGKSATSHAHAISDTTGLQTALDGKAATSHSHAISDTTWLQTALDGKQASLGFTAENAANKNSVSGYAGLDASSKLTSSQVPWAAPGTIGSTTPSTGAFTTLSASSTVSGAGFSTYLASPPAIGGTAAAAGSFTTLAASSTVSGTGMTNRFAAPGPIGSTTPSTGKFTTITETNLLVSNTAPTISSGFGTSPSISANNGTAAFRINVGTGGTATSGVIGLPAATAGWNCQLTDITTRSTTVTQTLQTASTTTTATVGNFNSSMAAAAWVASDILAVSCFAY